jgi:PhnB protein
MQPTRLNPYISFKNNAREAMDFYHSVFGGNLTLNTYGDSGMSEDPSEANNLMHAMLEAENGLVIMGADTPNSMTTTVGDNMSISLSGEDDAELRGYWEKLIEGGQVVQPLEVAPWGDAFGMVTDKFGIHWMVNITAAKAE